MGANPEHICNEHEFSFPEGTDDYCVACGMRKVDLERIEWLENDRRELAAMLDFYLTDEGDTGWGLQTKITRDAFRATALPEATSAFGMWEEDTAAEKEI
jgi:hypothetical protein